MPHSNSEEYPAFSRGESSIGILFVRVLIFVQLLPGPLFASRNDWSGPSGMDFLFPRRWRLVEMGHNYMAYSLRPRICRLGQLISAYVFLTILIVGHFRYPLVFYGSKRFPSTPINRSSYEG